MREDERQRVQRIKKYVLSRLREELANAPRGAQARLAKKLGVSGAHLSSMLSPRPTRAPGEDFRRMVAAHWNVSYAQLEAIAIGEDVAPLEDPERVVPPNLSGVLDEYVWMEELPNELRMVVREQAAAHYTVAGSDYGRSEWQRIVTGLEREALALVARRSRTATEPPRSRTRRSR